MWTSPVALPGQICSPCLLGASVRTSVPVAFQRELARGTAKRKPSFAMHWIKGQACQNVYSINRYDKLAWEIHQESRGANQGTLRSTGSAPLLSSLTASLNEEGLLSERCLQTQPRWSRNPIPCFARGELGTLLVIRFARPLRAGKMSIQRLLPHRPSVKVLHGWRMRSSLSQLEHYNYLQKKN